MNIQNFPVEATEKNLKKVGDLLKYTSDCLTVNAGTYDWTKGKNLLTSVKKVLKHVGALQKRSKCFQVSLCKKITRTFIKMSLIQRSN